MTDRPIPRATYRLQLTKDFPFSAAKALAPYLGKLGVSHAYLSPVLKARRGSTHGYDTVDHTTLNPELGTQRDFEDMAAALRVNGIGIILDIVPNHMGIGGDENELWLDVLKWGSQSRYADWFDINWLPSEPGLHNKVLVPMLSENFGDALERGAFELRYHEADQSFAVWMEGTHKLPISPHTYSLVGDPAAFERYNTPQGRADLARLIEAQHWRPARYSVAADDINYRRFFIVSDLAGIRVERDDVFDRVHALTFDLVRDGLVDGLRVDHIDGLYDPKAYCVKLRQKCPRPIYLVVEKILAPHETVREDWDVEGTTGYEFAGAVTRLLTDPKGEAGLTAAYETFVGERPSLDEEMREAKRNIIDYEMAAELDALTVRLRKLARSVPRTADLTRNAIRSALREVVAAMPVYRSYVDGTELADEDRRNIAVAIANARRATPALDPAVFEFLNDVLTAQLCRTRKQYDAGDVLEAARRVQQYTGPVMAKGLEDTALYRYNRLIALSDVGQRPDRFTSSIARFHDFNKARRKSTPHGMLTTSSHDTKRGEDVRARIAALSGMPDEWSDAVNQWREILRAAGAPELESNDIYYFFQLLLGAWPTTLRSDAAADVARFRERVEAAMLKSVREARQRTNWSVPQTTYEEAVTAYVRTSLSQAAFLTSFQRFEQMVGAVGAQNGLIEAVLKLTVPGVPDIYQGAELWEQSMVDPDNRRAVDFAVREAGLTSDIIFANLASTWRDGGIKQNVIQTVLRYRAARPEIFAFGTYEPIDAGEDIIGFVRRYDEAILVVAARLYPWRSRVWDEGTIRMPRSISSAPLEPIIGDTANGTIAFRELPVAVLVTPST